MERDGYYQEFLRRDTEVSEFLPVQNTSNRRDTKIPTEKSFRSLLAFRTRRPWQHLPLLLLDNERRFDDISSVRKL